MIKTSLSTAIGGVGFYTKNTLVIGGGHKSEPEPPFDIASLFSGGEQGLWLDRNDLSTLYRDLFGTMPVTSRSQQIAMILDKSQRVLLGDNISMVSHIVKSDDSVQYTKLVDDAVYAHQFFKIKYTPLALPQAGSMFFEGVGGGTVRYVSDSTAEFVIHTSALGAIRAGGLSKANFEYTDVTVQKLHGNHAYQRAAAPRPLLEDNIQFDGIDDALNVMFSAALSNCTVVTVKHGEQVQILEAQSVAQLHIINQDFNQYLLINRALTTQERSQVTDYFNKIGAAR